MEEEIRKGKVMIAIDESECSRYAVKWALENLRDKLLSDGLIIYTVYSVDYSGVYAGSFGTLPTDMLTTLQENQRKFAASLLAKAKEVCARQGVEAETLFVMGNPKEAICDAVQKFQCRLLVVGSHSRGAIQRAFLGSVSNYCVHNAKCPVLVVRA